MNSNPNAVLKVGGSLIDYIPALIRQIESITLHDCQSILIVPGGGVFADNIRKFQQIYSISDDAAHWMAVLAMEQYAYYLIDRTGIKYTDRLEELEPGISILLPYQILHQDDNELKHSWDATSDTIAAWVAHRIGSRLIKVTDVDGIYMDGELLTYIKADDLMSKQETCVDRALPGFLIEHGMDCMIVNGKYPIRILAALNGETTTGTFISGRASFKSV